MVLNYDNLADLVYKAQTGDTEAFAQIYHMTYPIIYAVALKKLANHEEALDLTQDSFAKIFDTLDTLKQPTYFLPWAKRITFNLCVNHLVKNSELLSPDITSIIDKTSAPAQGPEEILVASERQQAIIKAVDSLPTKYRDAFKLKNYEDRSVKEISTIMECPEGTVKSRLFTARKLIIQQLRNDNNFHSFSLFLYPASALVPLTVKIASDTAVGTTAMGTVAAGTAIGSADTAAKNSLSTLTGGTAKGAASLTGVAPVACTVAATVAVSTAIAVDTPVTPPPYVLNQEFGEGTFILTLDDQADMIVYEDIYGINHNGEHFTPISYNSDTWEVVVPWPEGDFTLHIPNIHGDVLDAIFDIEY